MSQVLEGIRVIDLAQMWAAPGVSMYLGDQGAEVIKVEPRTGDMSRGLGTTPYLKENSRSFMVVNRNKRGIALDLRKPAGREVVLRLARNADVLVENFRPGVVERLGVGYDDLKPLNPRLIYCSVSGYGRKGPYTYRAAYDRVLQGLSGAMFRRMPDGTPISTGVWIADCSVPMLMAYGIMLALWEREKTGLGQRVNTSLLQAAVAMQSVDLVLAEDDPTPKQDEGYQGTGSTAAATTSSSTWSRWRTTSSPACSRSWTWSTSWRTRAGRTPTARASSWARRPWCSKASSRPGPQTNGWRP